MVAIQISGHRRRWLQTGSRQSTPLFQRLKNYVFASTERQKRSQNLAPVLVIISANSLVFSRKIITSTGFYQCCAAGASAPVVVKNQSPIIDDTVPIRKFSIDLGSYTRTCKTQQTSLRKGSLYGVSVSTPHRQYGHARGHHFGGCHA